MMPAEDIDRSREDNEVIGALDKLTSQLSEAIKTIRPPEKSIITLDSGIRKSTHVRMRIYELVFTAVDAAQATVTLTIGTLTYVFNFSLAISMVVPLPIIVDRGVDVTLSTTGDGVSGWLTYTPE